MTIQPIGNQILVEVDKPGNISQGGILMIDASLPIPRNATVILVGSGRVTKKGVRIPIEFKAGDRLYLDIGERVEIIENGRKLCLTSADKVLGVVTETP